MLLLAEFLVRDEENESESIHAFLPLLFIVALISFAGEQFDFQFLIICEAIIP
jgi:hypothetical protein